VIVIYYHYSIRFTRVFSQMILGSSAVVDSFVIVPDPCETLTNDGCTINIKQTYVGYINFTAGLLFLLSILAICVYLNIVC